MIELTAWDDRLVELTQEQATAIEREDLADVLASSTTGHWRVRTGSRIGVVIGDDWELRVRPRLRIPRLMFLLGYASDPNGWRRLISGFDVDDELFAAIANGFSWHATFALDRGLLRGYVHHEERHVDVRGRVRFGDQIARGGGLPIPVELSFDEFTDDILENQILKTATLLLLRLPRIPSATRQRLRRLRSVLEDVEPILAWRRTKAPPMTRLNDRYGPALRLAEIVLASASTSELAGDVSTTTFVFDMNKVFEDFVTVALRESMRRHGGTLRDQVVAHSLDVDGKLGLKPDLSWWSGSECLALLDAKYKAIGDGLMRHDDAYQMLAYCVAYGLPRGYLVYAQDSGQESRVHHVRNLGVQIVVSALDVRAQPEDLLAQVDGLADEVVAGAPATWQPALASY